ncbi:peptidoglycan-binding protein LysM [Roseobacter sp. YSTF-M11]|uniref:Potassium binding protein Kbp n=1 Tax=Roseobacter insulae TaxID=2859783 RepID=A0A9X1FS94_9RHOB|nr:peptidoglycan-binding protein LysM [Roseobacter insulae]MBW4706687.1 peptidoglycan-binding protein LysM [Roseobacter insulae]
MGLWNFIKSAGSSLVGGAEAGEAPTEAALTQELENIGLDAKGADIKVDGDKVTVSGGALSVEEREKIILAVGNVEGVAAVEADTEADPVFHTVEKGDTLWAISSKTLGDGNRYKEIFEANTPMLSDPDKIYPGQVLRIPQA